MKRTIIKIDETLCNGCGACVKGCHEGALQMIDGKARIISDLFCDGLGACIGDCPVGAIELEEREAEPYDERIVMERMIPKGEKTIIAHLTHLRDHNETEYYNQGVEVLKEKGLDISVPVKEPLQSKSSCGSCPGEKEMSFAPKAVTMTVSSVSQISQLRQWPVQLHLLNPQASYFQGADVVLAADCTAYALGDFHSRYIKGKIIAIACPKLDSGKEKYIEKLISMIDDSQINTLTVIMMEVPCCGGLLGLAHTAISQAKRKIPVKQIVVGIKGDVLKEEWI
ncbi:MAG: 4Fe-4S binding protein [Bacteroidetes bacterium]|nr:4Fe-4S binding protein [Bacteroidota bacterium]